MEKIVSDTWSTLKCLWKTTTGPIQGSVDANLPGFGYKVLGIVGLLIGYNLFVMYVTSRTEAWMFLEKLRLYAVGDELVKKGFFMSDAEDSDTRGEAYAHTTDRLNAMWED